MSSYTLGLDIGSNSIGWAIVDERPKLRIVDLGVRVFPEGVDRDTKGLEKSKNAARRDARSARRNRWRKTRRRERLIRTLRRVGMLPETDGDLSELLATDPYEVRAKGLNERLELHELGRAFYHINQRRGFKSNRKTGKAKEDGKVAKGAGELASKIRTGECQTLGEYFANTDSEEERIRGHYTFRSMYEEEFHEIWSKQREFYAEIMTDDLLREIRDEIIFFQRPLKPVDDLIGDCDLEPGEKRCPRGDWYARHFRMLQDVNNLRIHNADGTVLELTKEERESILEATEKAKEVKFSSIRKLLGLLESQEFNAEYEVNEKGKKVEKLKGDALSAAMRNKKAFGAKVWDSMEEGEKIRLNEWLVELEDDELGEKLRETYGLNDDQVEAVLSTPLPRGYMSLSRKAIRKLLPLMKNGKLTSEALTDVYPNGVREGETELKDILGAPPELRNPIVQQVLYEIRKVVNAIIREYGRPDRIKIEMARDVKGSAKERRELHFRMLENQKRNEEVREKLREMGMINPTRENVIKHKLWDECGVCPYTGRQITQDGLFGPHPEFQIEHILPYSRSLDDSYMNKTLCHVDENRAKSNKTPYEAYERDEKRYEQIKHRIKTLPWPKRRKFLQKEIELDECIKRELNDTRYICREAVRYLKGVCKNVQGTRGQVTAELRHQWGLNSILSLLGEDTKNRDDHRHHAVDAAVVAITKNEHLRRLAQSKYEVNAVFEAPWDGFRDEMVAKVNRINVSHRVRRKVSGPLHEETSYGPTGETDDKGQEYYVYRKKLEDLSLGMVEQIVDPVVKAIVKERLSAHGVGADGKRQIPTAAWSEPLYMRQRKSEKRVQIKKVRIKDVKNNLIPLKDASGKPYRAVAPGNNHHIEIFECMDKKGKVKRGGSIVTMFEAVQRSRRGERVVNREQGEGKAFVCSLGGNEMFMLETKSCEHVLHRVQYISLLPTGPRIVLRPHNHAGKLSESDRPPVIQRKTPNTLKGYKVTVDPLGRIHRAND